MLYEAIEVQSPRGPRCARDMPLAGGAILWERPVRPLRIECGQGLRGILPTGVESTDCLLTDIVQVWARIRPGHARIFGTQRGLKPLPADGAHLKALEVPRQPACPAGYASRDVRTPGGQVRVLVCLVWSPAGGPSGREEDMTHRRRDVVLVSVTPSLITRPYVSVSKASESREAKIHDGQGVGIRSRKGGQQKLSEDRSTPTHNHPHSPFTHVHYTQTGPALNSKGRTFAVAARAGPSGAIHHDLRVPPPR